MKRSPLHRRSTLRSQGFALPALSKKRKAQVQARAVCVATVIERDGHCQFHRLVSAHWGELSASQHARVLAAWDCHGRLTAHEPAHRRNVDITDPASCMAVCQFHNGFAEDEPALSYLIGLLVKGNGLGLRGSLPAD